jgi:phenylacetate-CoA ligase
VNDRQLERLRELFAEILPGNSFQARRLAERGVPASWDDFLELPLLTKQELVADAAAHPPFGSNLTYALERYTRFHQTSGTTGPPLRVLDTAETWDWWGRCWLEVFRTAGVKPGDRVFFAFSFAPFIGFWSAFHGVEMLGAMTVPAGSSGSVQRLRLLQESGSTVLVSTPTYALHLAEVAKREGIRIDRLPIRATIHAGEPGASIAATRARIAEAWGAAVYDHAGASEAGAWGLPCPEGRGVWVNEQEFIAEVRDPRSLEPTAEGETGELVITNLGRGAWPVIRYRTGDMVRPRRVDGRLLLEGGVLGRADDMITVRGVNVYPSALEGVIRQVGGAVEFRITVTRDREMDEVGIEVEAEAALTKKISQEIHNEIGIRSAVTSVEHGFLPRWESKAKRFQDLRGR